jgi:orotate phosphoribosyltransferase
VEQEFGIPVVSIIRLEQVLDYLKSNPEFAGHAETVASYRDRYGV